jgi:uncharacterized membrane protein YoaK (UPF0700 family)
MDINPLFVFALAGIAELYRRLVHRDFEAAGLITVCAIAGAILGHFVTTLGMDWFTGLLGGFTASGLITVVGAVRGKSAPTPTTLTER